MISIQRRLWSNPVAARLRAVVRRWQIFSETAIGARLVPIYAALLGAALGALVADRLIRSMWRHAIFTGPDQWRTVALILAVLWVVIGAVAALAVLGPPDADDAASVPPDEDRAPHMANPLEQP